MINMMKADFFRLIRNKAFYIAAAIILLMAGLSIYIVQPGYLGMTVSISTQENNPGTEMLNNMSYEEMQSFSVSDMREMMLKYDGYELDRDILGANTNLYYVFIFIAVIVLTSDFSCGGVKNTLSSAISRRKYYFSKLGFITICCLVLFFLNTYFVYFGNLIFNGENLSAGLGEITKISFMQLPVILALISLLTGIGFMVKRTAIFNTIAIPLIIVVQFLFTLLKTLFKVKDSVMGYEFQTMLIKLAGSPSDSYMVRSYIFCAVIIAVFVTLGYMSFKKAEIK